MNYYSLGGGLWSWHNLSQMSQAQTAWAIRFTLPRWTAARTCAWWTRERFVFSVCGVHHCLLSVNEWQCVFSSAVCPKSKTCSCKMASRRAMLSAAMEPLPNSQSDPLRELFEACKTGDIARVRKLITPQTVNARDTAGRKSTPLHFAAGTLHSWAFLQ